MSVQTRKQADSASPLHQNSSVICPLSHTVMADPVVTIYGHYFDRHALNEYLERNNVCPFTQRPLQRHLYFRDEALKQSLQPFLDVPPAKKPRKRRKGGVKHSISLNSGLDKIDSDRRDRDDSSTDEDSLSSQRKKKEEEHAEEKARKKASFKSSSWTSISGKQLRSHTEHDQARDRVLKTKSTTAAVFYHHKHSSMSSRSPSPSGALSRQQSSRGMNPSSHRSRRGDADANGVAQMVGDVSDRSTMMPDSDMGRTSTDSFSPPRRYTSRDGIRRHLPIVDAEEEEETPHDTHGRFREYHRNSHNRRRRSRSSPVRLLEKTTPRVMGDDAPDVRLANSPSPSPSPVRSLQQSEGLQHHRSGSWASINVVDTTTNEKVLSRSCNLRSSSLIGNVDDGTHSGSSTAGSYTSSHVDDIHRVQSNPIAYNRTKASGLSPRTGGSSVNSPRSSSSSISPRPNISRNSPGSVRRGGGDSEGSQDYFTTHLTAHVSPPRTGSLRMSSSLGHLAPHQRSRRRRQEQEERGAHLPASSSSPSRRVTIGEELTDVQLRANGLLQAPQAEHRPLARHTTDEFFTYESSSRSDSTTSNMSPVRDLMGRVDDRTSSSSSQPTYMDEIAARWYYRSGNQWKVYSWKDSALIERAERRSQLETVLVKSNRAIINLKARLEYSVRKKNQPGRPVLRGTWFMETKNNEILPYPEDLATTLEDMHKHQQYDHVVYSGDGKRGIVIRSTEEAYEFNVMGGEPEEGIGMRRVFRGYPHTGSSTNLTVSLTDLSEASEGTDNEDMLLSEIRPTLSVASGTSSSSSSEREKEKSRSSRSAMTTLSSSPSSTSSPPSPASQRRVISSTIKKSSSSLQSQSATLSVASSSSPSSHASTNPMLRMQSRSFPTAEQAVRHSEQQHDRLPESEPLPTTVISELDAPQSPAPSSLMEKKGSSVSVFAKRFSKRGLGGRSKSKPKKTW